MTRDEVRYIRLKKFVDEFNRYRQAQEANGVGITAIKDTFARKKKIAVITIGRRIKDLEEYEQRNNADQRAD